MYSRMVSDKMIICLRRGRFLKEVYFWSEEEMKYKTKFKRYWVSLTFVIEEDQNGFKIYDN